MDDNWRKQLLEKDTSLSESHKKILKDGPSGLSEAWVLGGLKKRYEELFKP